MKAEEVAKEFYAIYREERRARTSHHLAWEDVSTTGRAAYIASMKRFCEAHGVELEPDEPEHVTLAKRLTKTPGFKWRAGMAVMDEEGVYLGTVYHAPIPGDPMVRYVDSHGAQRGYHDKLGVLLPDVRRASTLGAVASMAKWYAQDPTLHVVYDPGKFTDLKVECVVENRLDKDLSPSFASEIEAWLWVLEGGLK